MHVVRMCIYLLVVELWDEILQALRELWPKPQSQGNLSGLTLLFFVLASSPSPTSRFRIQDSLIEKALKNGDCEEQVW